MATTSKVERRRLDRDRATGSVIRIEFKDGQGHARYITADICDRSDQGIGISLITPLKPGITVSVRGKVGPDQAESQRKAVVTWCQERSNGKFQAGLEFPDGRPRESDSNSKQDAPAVELGELDCYEVMQLSPNADTETIARVYRLLAQRYHPDNTETGNSDMFVRLTEAHEILSNPERRAGYDATYRQAKRLSWKIFDQKSAPSGKEAEQRKREGILSLLYAATVQNPEGAFMTLHTFEELLGCPREHLEAALWYLRGKGFIQRGDNGRYKITVQGFDEVELGAGRAVGFKQELLEAGTQAVS